MGACVLVATIRRTQDRHTALFVQPNLVVFEFSAASRPGRSLALSRNRDCRPITVAAKQVEEHRRQEDAEKRHAQHAAKDGKAECPAHLGAGAATRLVGRDGRFSPLTAFARNVWTMVPYSYHFHLFAEGEKSCPRRKRKPLRKTDALCAANLLPRSRCSG